MRMSDWSSDVCSSDLLGILKSVGVPICAAKIDDHGLARGDRYPLYSDIDLGDSERKEYRRFAAHTFMNCWLNQRGVRAQRSEENTSELQSLMRISYAVFCLKQNILTIGFDLLILHISIELR